MAFDAELVKAVQAAARRLGVAASWADSGRALDVADDFLYEMHVLFELLEDASSSHHVRYRPGAGKAMHAFPRKGANKQGRPRFELSDSPQGEVLAQLCAGTRVTDTLSNTHAPDISLQASTSPEDMPVANDVLNIWECKYRKNGSDGQVQRSEYSEFAQRVELLGLQPPAQLPVKLSRLSDLAARCLVTNGQPSTFTSATRAHHGVTEIASFFPGQSHSKHS